MRRSCRILILIGISLTLIACMSKQRRTVINMKRSANATLPHHLGSQESYLLKHLQGTDAQVIHEDDRLRIILPKYCNFKTGSSVVNPHLMRLLDVIAIAVKDNPMSVAVVHGYADSRGHYKYNHALSERRSHAVIAYMDSQGMPLHQYITEGHSERHPRGNNATTHGRHINRRIEITLHEAVGRHDSYNFNPLVK